MARDQVFISYSHADSDWLERLQTMLVPLQRRGMLDVWADTRIQPGQLWKEEIQKALARAKVAVLLVSPDFLASEFIYENELPKLLEAASKEGLTILWIPVRPSLCKETAIARFQAAYDPKKPLSTLPPAQQEVELVHIAEKLIAVRPLPSLSPPLPLPLPLPPSPLPPPKSTSAPPSTEQVAPSPSLSAGPPSQLSAAPSGFSTVASPQRVWRQLLIVLVLGIVGGAGVYHWVRFETAPFSNVSVSRDLAPGKDVAESTEPQKSSLSAVPKASPLPSIENIHGWSAQQVQDLQQRTARALKQAVEFHDPLKDGGQGPVMVVIPAGRFQMGSPDTGLGRDKNERQHEVEVTKFAISKYEVTFEEYDRFAGATKREKPSDEGWGRGRRPVINVTWSDAVAYVDWISKQTGQTYRLPTEAEWEYAVRAGTTTPFYFGATISTDQANYDGNSVYGEGRKGVYRQKTTEVGQFPANAWGLYDMHGNVWEWTCSLYDENYGGNERHCAEPSTGGARVLRGGSWAHVPYWLRGAARFWFPPLAGYYDLGFRLARTFPFTL
jgi:formylglycine-generating enzyme required for sulfatase activity